MNIDFEKILKLALPFVKMLLILIIGHFLIVYLLKLTKKGLNRSSLDDSLKKFLLKTLNILMHLFVILSALNTIGISTTGLLAALSAAAVAVAVGLKDSLGNVAGGILLLISPRFSTGDYIETESNSGTVVSVDLLHTTIKTFDNRQISIPNGILINSNITNYSKEPIRRVDITFPIPYEVDVKKAEEIIVKTILTHPLVLKEPAEPLAKVSSYGDSAVNIVTKSWCDNKDYWTVYYDLTEQVREALEKEGISFPYNKLDVHIVNDNK